MAGNKEIDGLIDGLGIEYEAKFVPFSESRNKGEKDKSLNWVVTLRRNKVELKTDYMRGIGHHPQWGRKPKLQVEVDAISKSCETGFIYKPSEIVGFWRIGELERPDLRAVLYSLLIDFEVLDYASFEDWAGALGYDADSRKAEKIYNACLKIARTFRLLFSEEEIDRLREVYQGY